MDEPTVIGKRPIGPSRAAPRVGQPMMAAAPVAALAPTPRVVAAGPTPDQVAPAPPGGTSDVIAQLVLDPKSPADVLTAAATPLFLVVGQLREMIENADVNALRREMVDQLRRFEERAVRNQARGGDVSAARYILCALIDEAVMTTPWGSASAWSTNSLLNQFHNETWGGEKVFQILDRIKSDPAKFVALLKLIDLCLLMGFQGKFRVVDGGRERLDDLRADLERLLRQYAPAAPNELSPQWRGVEAKRGVRGYVPLWTVSAVAGFVAVVAYIYLRWRLAGELSPVDEMLQVLAGGGAK